MPLVILRMLCCLFVAPIAATLVRAQADVVPTATYVSVPGTEPTEHPLNISRMDLDVRFSPYRGLVQGRVVHTFTVLQNHVDSLIFHAIGIRILQTTLNGRPARITQTDSVVVVHCEPPLMWDSTGTVTFTYEATPRKGLYFVGWQDPSGRMPRQIWTQGQAFDHRHWIPMYDDMNDKMVTTTTTTFDSLYTVVSNGDLRRVESNSDGTRTWRYAMTKPHSSYLLMIAIGRYDTTLLHSASGVPLECYWYTGRPETVGPTYKQTAEAMDFLEREIGIPYPWGIYRQVPVADYIFGAMENTSATIFGDFYLKDERGQLDRDYVNTNIHEMTHQWFGDLISGRSRTHLWLQESFATYYPHLYQRSYKGEEAFEWSRRHLHDQALRAGERDRLPIVHPEAGGARYYPKGAAVIDMMRSTFGDAEVRRVIRHYLQQHAFGLVETNDLYQAFQDTLGLSPRWFFDQWLYRGGEPHFKITTRSVVTNDLKGASQATVVDIAQIHHVDPLTGYFRMPVSIQVWYEDRSSDSVRVWVDGPHTSATIPNPENRNVAFVLFDPGSTVLKRVSFERSSEQLLAQLDHAPHMIDRYDALVALGAMSLPDMEMLDMLEGVMDRESFHAMRSEAVRQAIQLVNNGTTHAWALVEKGLKDPEVEVRKSTLRHLPLVPNRLKETVEGLLADPSFGIAAEALRKLARSFPSDVPGYLKRLSGVRSPHAQIEIECAYLKASQGDTASASQLADFAGVGFEFITRQNAMDAIKRLGQLSVPSAKALLSALFSTNGRLSERAKSTLEHFANEERWKELLRTLVQSEKLEPPFRAMVEPLIR